METVLSSTYHLQEKKSSPVLNLTRELLSPQPSPAPGPAGRTEAGGSGLARGSSKPGWEETPAEPPPRAPRLAAASSCRARRKG